MLEPGESLLGLRGGVPPDWWLPSEDGRTLLPDDPAHVFYADCPPAVAARATAEIVPQNRAVFEQELRSAAWHERAVDLRRSASATTPCRRALQERMSARAGTVSRIDSSHSPFLSRPGEVTAIIQETLAVVIAGG